MTAWFNALMQGRLIRRGAPLAILVLIVGALAAGVALGNTATCTNTAATLTGSAFEIDVDANQVVNNPGCIDWLDIDPNQAGRQPVPATAVKQDTASGSSDESFGEGTKEDTALPTVVDGGIPPNKSDLKAFGVFTEAGEVSTANPTGKFLELLWTRVQDPSGTTNMDFELNQKFCNPSATPSNCAPNGITPLRTANVDKLITYDLDRGGTRATISIRTWNGTAWGSATVLTSQTPPQALGTVNSTQITAANSLSSLGALSPRTFGEASISFSALFGQNTCGQFGSAYLKSRSSAEFNAALKDFVPPTQVSISNCAALTTTANPNADNQESVTIGNAISDTAHLSGVTNTAGGTIAFHLFPSLSDCQNGTNEINTGLSPVAVSGPGNYGSGNFTPTAVGTYYWVANYSGDSSNSSVAGKCGDANESSTVVKKQPAISTDSTDSVTIGGSISDDASLTGATADASGTITFKAYGPDDATCSGAAAFTSTKDVSGNGTYTSDPFTPTAVGTYRWIASYSGDAKNLSVSGACNDANESSVVNKQQPAISTNASAPVTIDSPISDVAHLSGATNDASGTITFKLYSDAQCTNEVNTGLQPVQVNGNGDYNSGDFTPTAVGTYYWIASYSGDNKNLAVSGSCGDANESSAIAKKQPAISTDATASAIVGDPISDVAHLSGATNDAGGTITFKLYGPNDADCSGTAAFTSTKDVSGNGTYTSDAFSPTAVGTYRWIASYSGDAKNLAVSGSCGDANEETDVVQKQPAISTTATGSVTIDSPISDVAHLSGATNDASGTITFKLYSDAQCTNEVNTGLQPVQVNGNGDYNSGDFTPTAVGTYYWIASYSGDNKNLAVSGSCNDANESSVVGKANSNVQTNQSLTPQDSADLSAGAGGTPTGEVTFKLYGPSADPTQPPDCTGTAVYTETVGLTGGSASTSNSAYDIDDASEGTYSWQVIYGGDSTHKAVTSCVEHFTVSITNGGIVTSS